SLYIVEGDGHPSVAFGMGAASYPNAADRALSGINVGSDINGNNQAQGTIDELETFNYPLDILVGQLADEQYSVPTYQTLANPPARTATNTVLLDIKLSPDKKTVFVKSGRSIVAYNAATMDLFQGVGFSNFYSGSLHGLAVNIAGTRVYATGSDKILHSYL